MNRTHAFAGALLLAVALAAPAALSAQEQAAAVPPPSTASVSASAATDSAPPETYREPRRRPDVLTRQELAESGTTNLLSAVERLRPQWLRARRFTNLRGSGADIIVYMGTTQLGGPDALRLIALEFAEEIRFLDSSEASNTLPGLGSRAVAGAIVIVRPGHPAP